MLYMTKQLHWDQIAPSVASLFSVWSHDNNIVWVKTAWQALNEQGLTRFKNQQEKQDAILNLLTLARIYHQFCDRAFGITDDSENLIPMWLDDLEESEMYISLVRLGCLLHKEVNTNNDEFLSFDCEANKLPSLLISATNNCIQDVVKALLIGFGSKESLFLGLWNSSLNIEDGQIKTVNELDCFDASPAWNYLETLL